MIRNALPPLNARCFALGREERTPNTTVIACSFSTVPSGMRHQPARRRSCVGSMSSRPLGQQILSRDVEDQSPAPRVSESIRGTGGIEPAKPPERSPQAGPEGNPDVEEVEQVAKAPLHRLHAQLPGVAPHFLPVQRRSRGGEGPRDSW